MRRITVYFRGFVGAMGLALVLTSGGCHQSENSGPGDAASSKNTADAAIQLEQAFATAPLPLKHAARTAAEAIRGENSEQAVAALAVIQNTGGLSNDQGAALRNVSEALERRLMSAMMAGDANAKRAYDLLKKLKRD